MASAHTGGVRLHYEEEGAGPPVLLVHGSWGDHASWGRVRPALAARHRVVAYDRRGHSQSGPPQGVSRLDEHVRDAIGLIETLDLAPVHLVGSSLGGILALRLVARRPDLVRSLVVHEPPLMGLVTAVAGEHHARIHRAMDLIARGENEAGARVFVEEVGFGPGHWARLPEDLRRAFVQNAPLWLHEMREPGVLDLDLEPLGRFAGPALVTSGTASPDVFPQVADLVAKALPRGTRATYAGAAHAPHLTHPDAYAATVLRFLSDR